MGTPAGAQEHLPSGRQCVCARACVSAHTHTHSHAHTQLSGLQLQLSPWGKVSFFSPSLRQVIIPVIRCGCQGCWLPPLCTCSFYTGSVSWPMVCFLPQPVLVKVMGLPLVTVTALICLIF